MGDIVERLCDWGHHDWFYVTTDLLEENQNVRFEAADEIERLRKALSACAGYMLNAKIDLEGRTPKRTTLDTLEGGIRLAKAALTSPHKETADGKAG